VPEQPLFGDAFGNPPQRRAFEALVAREAVCFVGRRLVTAPALAFGLCQRLTKAMHQAFEEPARGLWCVDCIVVGHLAVRLVAVGPDRNEEDLHAWAVR
jgi:hypothetical protein